MKKFAIFSSILFLPLSTSVFLLKDKIPLFNRHANIKKDETRFNNNYYGLNWGSKTDEIVFDILFQIQNKLETGDLILFKEGNIFKDYLKILPFFRDVFNRKNELGELDNAGLILRTTGEVYVCYVKSPGKINIIPYSEFLSNNNLLMVKIRFKDKVKNETTADDKISNINFFQKIKKQLLLILEIQITTQHQQIY